MAAATSPNMMQKINIQTLRVSFAPRPLLNKRDTSHIFFKRLPQRTDNRVLEIKYPKASPFSSTRTVSLCKVGLWNETQQNNLDYKIL